MVAVRVRSHNLVRGFLEYPLAVNLVLRHRFVLCPWATWLIAFGSEVPDDDFI